MRKKIGVLLSGSGVKDGSEIHEATLTLLYLDQAGVEILCMAPNVDQAHVINHLNEQQSSENRNILEESARIARGDIRDLSTLSAEGLDAVILPGGFGAAKNLCTYAFEGSDCSVLPEVSRLLRTMHAQKKAIGAICIAPVIVAAVFHGTPIHPLLTIGTDPATAANIEAMGSRHQDAFVDDIVADKDNKIVTTPAYMLGPGISDIAKGIKKLVKQIVAWA